MKVCITKAFTFDAAHNLVNYKGKCEALHGHTYRLEIKVCGDSASLDNGLLMDFGDLKNLVDNEVISKLDHTYLNDRFPQPSTELVAMWIFETLKPHIERLNLTLSSVKLFETATSWVEIV
ncbi:6-carboxytetrahydropterin synthase QueD [Coprothermobacter platensis]|uniref:6-carboxytetrahydropterin synthase QueD n=1 Tax=Coprothermobacter platensis TaxID=108819 RepID=UPI00038031F2|nr:6-carboxytetrahydropterin synthase QueD [Coprothermobacter platensis]